MITQVKSLDNFNSFSLLVLSEIYGDDKGEFVISDTGACTVFTDLSKFRVKIKHLRHENRPGRGFVRCSPFQIFHIT